MTDQPLVERLRALSHARLRLGRAGSSLPTRAQLAFELDHARARDAVVSPFEPVGLADALGREVIEIASRAADRTEYLRRPDLGRRLDDASAARLTRGDYDLAIVIADGLSPAAVHAHAASVALALFERLADWAIAPVTVARLGRVALGDEVGEALGAKLVCVLIGERPGLTAPDSLGAYLTWNPAPGRQDSERNCISNIRPPRGLSYDKAADTIARLLTAARRSGATGIGLKDGPAALPRAEG
ncbi:ethanolamine ammonia-lyase [Novosphingobium sp. PC22D]|uniref:ethanolamine ammonia-lyase subunit EutC n=1 Tax=Novosphingobium sp. PC22D TaxID=1962403 RepID=UPI000BEFAE57|nr:ethanolamine ammonia-lyase subunit EutC [Novosphingobium sp. PC22D]PEQ13698.1 ethanolamine ammonia-lyase [Novosphingobium sp. PC22D]